MTLKNYTTRIYSDCAVCASKDIAKSFTYCDRHYMLVKDSFDVWCCNKCGLYFLNPMPTANELMSYYPKTYYSYEDKEGGSTWKQSLVRFLRVEPSDLDRIAPVESKKILDFGCGSGWSLDLYKEKGYETYGLDLDENAISTAKKNGHIMSGVDLLTTNYDDSFFDFIRSNHSMEHIINPVEVVQEFHRILKDSGKLFIALPNSGSLMRSIFKKYWYYTGVPYHTFNYNLASLGILLQDNGFIIEKVGYRSSWQGIFGSLGIFLNRNSSKAALDSMLTGKLFRVFGILLSKVPDLLNRGDYIEIYAVKK
jgi:SAM-dependent methyltransferase